MAGHGRQCAAETRLIRGTGEPPVDQTSHHNSEITHIYTIRRNLEGQTDQFRQTIRVTVLMFEFLSQWGFVFMDGWNCGWKSGVAGGKEGEKVGVSVKQIQDEW